MPTTSKRFGAHFPFAAIACLLIAGAAKAADPANLSEGAPLSIEDTRVTEKGKWTYQLPLQLERRSNGDNRSRFEPEIKYGFAEGWQASASVPVLGGSASRTGSGDIRLGVLGRFNEESGWLPSFGASLGLDLPTGRDSEGLDSRLRLIASKSLPGRQRVHANALFERNDDPRPAERRHRRGFVLGYDVQLQEKTVLVADYLYEHARERGRHERLLELGVRQKVGEGVVGLGVGAGIGNSATDWRLALSWQNDF